MLLMRRVKKIFVVFFGCVVSLVLSIGLMYWIAEEFFFDKFFYQKSVEHGYWIQGKSLNERDFGKRSEDLIALDERFKLSEEGQVLGDTSESDDVFTIAVIGDSYVWGQGVRFEDTVTQVLERKLNKVKLVEVSSFARSGNSILDYLFMYDRIKRVYDVDLYVFVLVNNDVLLNEDGRLNGNDYGFIVENCFEGNLDRNAVYDIDRSSLSKKLDEFPMLDKIYWVQSEMAWRNPVNLCVMNESIRQLPLDNAIYLMTDGYYRNMPIDRREPFDTYRGFLKYYDKHIVEYEISEKYEKYSNKNDGKNYFTVSEKDGHPSELTHQIYADVLYKKIVENKEYGFNWQWR